MSSQPVGSAAEEAARLLAAAEEWCAPARSTGLTALATGAPECSVCPLCQAVSAVRSVKPETVEHLLDAAASLVAALRTTAAHTAHRHDPDPRRVQRIDVREA